MKAFYIYVLDPEGSGNFLLADSQKTYKAETELEALKAFAQVRKNDLDVEDLHIVSDDPFLIRIKGWTEAEDHSKFEITENTYEYIAKEAW